MQEPSRRLSPRARWVWRLQQVGTWGVLVIASVFVADLLEFGLLPFAVLAALVVAVLVVPALRWRRWRWDVQDEGIDIRQGTLTIRRTLVPWVRVQHVDTRRGLLEQALGLATVVVHTAAGGHTIPLLDFKDAELLRDRIAELARTDA
jgi:membrane protein YdbS with pleckstrin-like domain